MSWRGEVYKSPSKDQWVACLFDGRGLIWSKNFITWRAAFYWCFEAARKASVSIAKF